MKKNKLLFLVLIIGAAVSSCKKDNNTTTAPKVTTGVYVLSEGLYSMNNTTLTYYNFGTGTQTTDFYAIANGSGLGDTGNDILIYGGKIYTVVNVSSYVDVSDARTAKNIKKIDFKTASSAPRQPRYAIAYKNKVLVSAYDGTVAVIDTTTLAIEKNITVGPNPEQMAIFGDKLFVANSGGFNPVPDSTVSVVSLSTFTEVQKIKVGLNPGPVAVDEAGNLYVGCTGDYGTVGPKLVKVNTTTNTIVKTADTAVGKIRYYNGVLYATGGYLGVARVRALSTTDFSQKSANFVTDGTNIIMPYGLNIDPDNGDVYITDAKDYVSSGLVYCFDNTGKKKFSFSVTPGINPNTVAFIKQ